MGTKGCGATTARGAQRCPTRARGTHTTCHSPASWTEVPHPSPRPPASRTKEAQLASVPPACLCRQRARRAEWDTDLDTEALPAPGLILCPNPTLTHGSLSSHLAPSGGGSGSDTPSSCRGPGQQAVPPRSSERGRSAAGLCTGPGGLSGGPAGRNARLWSPAPSPEGP